MLIISTTKQRIIGWFYRRIGKPIFFKFDPELVHDRITLLGKLFGSNPLTRRLVRVLFNVDHPSLVQNVAGLHFRNPVGLSAGFDKNAQLINILPSVGFGHMEIGSVTQHPYEGNPKPRLYRLKKSRGLVVYYGLKNIGVKKIVDRIRKRKDPSGIIGISVAKTNAPSTADLAGGIADYVACLEYLESNNVGDYYTINISCPNTFGGEPFTTAESLRPLLSAITKLKIKKSIFIKMPTNLPKQQFDQLLQLIVEYKVTGVVIGNLTKVRDSNLIKDQIPGHIKGGISGKPTEQLSNDLIAYTYRHYGQNLIIVGVGGIFSAEDAYRKIRLGATLVQLITGMIFVGPQLIGEINAGLVSFLARDDFRNISEAVGYDVK